MKILYGVAGTGNGHISRALHLVPTLKKYGQVDVLISGDNHDIEPPFEVKYKKTGLTFSIDGKGHINIFKTLTKINLLRFIKDVHNLPVEDYDIIITDFEPITAWACQYKRKPCIHIGNFASFASLRTPRPLDINLSIELFIKFFVPATSYIGFGYEKYDSNIVSPSIRNKIRQLNITQGNHYTVYLNFYDPHYLYKILSQIKDTSWEIFTNQVPQKYVQGNCTFYPIESEIYLNSLASCRGVISYGGFQASAEALFLGKKLLVIPLERQYEQICNAAALEKLGIMVLKKLDKNFPKHFQVWVNNYKPVQISYPDNTNQIVDLIMSYQNATPNA